MKTKTETCLFSIDEIEHRYSLGLWVPSCEGIMWRVVRKHNGVFELGPIFKDFEKAANVAGKLNKK